MKSFLNGVLIGLPLAVLIGPILITMVQTTLEKGFKSGLLVAVGIWISDLLFILTVFYSIQYLLRFDHFESENTSINLWGGLVFILIGLFIFLGKSNISTDKNPLNKKDIISSLREGFLVNTINPFTFFFWITMLTNSFQSNNQQTKPTLLFALGILATIITTDFLKVYFAKKVKSLLTPEHIFMLRKISGGIVILMGVVLLFMYYF